MNVYRVKAECWSKREYLVIAEDESIAEDIAYEQFDKWFPEDTDDKYRKACEVPMTIKYESKLEDAFDLLLDELSREDSIGFCIDIT